MANTEIILTVGIILSAALLLFQLVSIFNVQGQLAHKSIVASFASELEGRVDKAAAAVENVNFTYVPPLKNYALKIENNRVLIKDKISNSETSFFKLSPQIANNSFENAKTIYIVKIKDEIFIFSDYQSNQIFH
jgi:hypothetical protein